MRQLITVVALGLLLLAAVRASGTADLDAETAVDPGDVPHIMVADDIARSWSDMVDQYQHGQQQQHADGLLFPADLRLVMRRHSEDAVVNALREALRREEEANQEASEEQADGKDVLQYLEKELEFIEPDAAKDKDQDDEGVIVILEKDDQPQDEPQSEFGSLFALLERLGQKAIEEDGDDSTTSTTPAPSPPGVEHSTGTIFDVLRMMDGGAFGALLGPGRRHPRDLRLQGSPEASTSAAAPSAPIAHAAPESSAASVSAAAPSVPIAHAAPESSGASLSAAAPSGSIAHAALTPSSPGLAAAVAPHGSPLHHTEAASASTTPSTAGTVDVNLSGVKDTDVRDVMESLSHGLLQVDTPPPPPPHASAPLEGLRIIALPSHDPTPVQAEATTEAGSAREPSTTPAWVVHTPPTPPVQVVKFVPVNATPVPEPIDLVKFAAKLGQDGVGEALKEIEKDDETFPGSTRILFPQGVIATGAEEAVSKKSALKNLDVSNKGEKYTGKDAAPNQPSKHLSATASKINLGEKKVVSQQKATHIEKLPGLKPVHEKTVGVPHMVDTGNNEPVPVVDPLREEPLKAVEEDPISLKFPVPIGNMDEVNDLLNMNVTFEDDLPASAPTSPTPPAATTPAGDPHLLGKLDKLLTFAKGIASIGPMGPGHVEVHVQGGPAGPAAAAKDVTSTHAPPAEIIPAQHPAPSAVHTATNRSANSAKSALTPSPGAASSFSTHPTRLKPVPAGSATWEKRPLVDRARDLPVDSIKIETALKTPATAKPAYLNRAIEFPLRDWHDPGAARNARGSGPSSSATSEPPPHSHPEHTPPPTLEPASPSPETAVLADDDLHFEIQDPTTTPDPSKKKKKKKKKKGLKLPFLVTTTTKAPWPRSLASLAPFLPFPELARSEDSQLRPPVPLRRPLLKPPPAPWEHLDHDHDYGHDHGHDHGHGHAYDHSHGYSYNVEVATLPPLPVASPVQQQWHYQTQGYQPHTYHQHAAYQHTVASQQHVAYQEAASAHQPSAAYQQPAVYQQTVASQPNAAYQQHGAHQLAAAAHQPSAAYQQHVAYQEAAAASQPNAAYQQAAAYQPTPCQATSDYLHQNYQQETPSQPAVSHHHGYLAQLPTDTAHQDQDAFQNDVLESPPPAYAPGAYQDLDAEPAFGQAAQQVHAAQPDYEPATLDAYGPDQAHDGLYGVTQDQVHGLYDAAHEQAQEGLYDVTQKQALPPAYDSPSNYMDAHGRRRRRSLDSAATPDADHAAVSEKSSVEPESAITFGKSDQSAISEAANKDEEAETNLAQEKVMLQEETAVVSSALEKKLSPEDAPTADTSDLALSNIVDKKNELNGVKTSPKLLAETDGAEMSVPAAPAALASPVPAAAPAALVSPVPAAAPAALASPVPAAAPATPVSPVPAAAPAAPALPVPAAATAAPASPVPAAASVAVASLEPAAADTPAARAAEPTALNLEDEAIAAESLPTADEADPDPLEAAAADLLLPVNALGSLPPLPRPPPPPRRLHHPHRLSPLHPGSDLVDQADAPQLARRARQQQQQHHDAAGADVKETAQAPVAVQAAARGPYSHHHPHMPPAMEDLIPKIGETEAEKAEREQKAVQRMIQVVNVLGSLQNFLSDRARTLVRRLSKIVEEEEGEKLS